MQTVSREQIFKDPLNKAIISTLAFFDIYHLPLTAKRVWELLYKHKATSNQVAERLIQLSKLGVIIAKNEMYGLREWDENEFNINQKEINDRWKKVNKYFWLLSSLPFIETICVINSVAMGNAGHESDIDFFVIVKPKCLYFVRSIVIVLLRLLRVYKTRNKHKGQFCLGFYAVPQRMALKELLLPGEDPYMAFWTGTLIPITGWRMYQNFIRQNLWVYSYLPNFDERLRREKYESFAPNKLLKKIFEIIFILPAIVLEPPLRAIHIRHTYKLPENHWPTSSTIADEGMLKLHALDPRRDLRRQFNGNLARFS
jgi:hypothetical protein